MFTTRFLSILTLTAILSGLTTNATAGPNADPPQNLLRLKPVVIEDAALRQEAFRVLAPADWKVEGEIFWRFHPTVPATSSLTARSPSGVEEIRFYPNVPFADGVRESAMQSAQIAGPDAMRFAAAAYPEGANYMGSEVRRICGTPAEYVEKIVLPRVRKDIRQFQIIAREDLPDWAKTSSILAESGSLFPTEAKAGKVRIAYTKDGKTLHEDFYVLLVFLKMGPITWWGAEVCSSVRGEKANLDFLGKVFQTMMQSTQIDLKWFARYLQAAQIVQDTMRQQQRYVMQIHKILTETNEYVTKIQRETYQKQQESRDRMNLAFSQVIRGVEEYKTPGGRTVELPLGYKRAWTNALGEYVLTDDSFFDPNRTLRGNWQEIERRSR